MSFFQKLKQGASKATEMAQQTVEITKLHTQVSAKQKEIERLYSSMGQAAFKAYVAGNFEQAGLDIEQGSKEILSIQKDIAELNKRVRELKNEKDCVCGKVVAVDTKFCPDCGHAFTEEQTQADMSLLEEPATETVEAKPAAVCISCASELEEGSKFCIHCGTSQTKEASDSAGS